MAGSFPGSDAMTSESGGCDMGARIFSNPPHRTTWAVIDRTVSHDRKSKVLAELKSDRSSVPCRTAVFRFEQRVSVHFEKPNARGQTSSVTQ